MPVAPAKRIRSLSLGSAARLGVGEPQGPEQPTQISCHEEAQTMRCHRTPTFESLESKRCLAVTAAVTAGGDLLVEGTADGAVEIVAVSAGTYRVSDNGVVVADADVLTGVTDDVRIDLEDAADGAVNSVTLNLGDQSVDAVYAYLGNGD